MVSGDFLLQGNGVRITLTCKDGPLMDLDLIALALMGKIVDPILTFHLEPVEYPDGTRFEGGDFDLIVKPHTVSRETVQWPIPDTGPYMPDIPFWRDPRSGTLP